MKLATFRDGQAGGVGAGAGPEVFGVVTGGRAVAFTELGDDSEAAELADVMSFLRGMPGSLGAAAGLAARAGGMPDAGLPLERVTLLAPVPQPAAILDCGLTPRHLANSAATMLRSSLPGIAGAGAALVARRIAGRPAGSVRYYKGNCQSVSGDGDVIPWPGFTQYLDIEPELALVTGAIPIGSGRAEVEAAIAGYTIFNDVSARDVQLGEMFFTGPATSKDLDHGNGLGPWLVTPDEIADPLDQTVEVAVGGRTRWEGSTTEYAMHPVDVVMAITSRQSLAAGTVVAFGTVPDTCGLDHGDWLCPGDAVSITMSGIGSLHQELGVPDAPPHTPWKRRDQAGLR